MVAYSFKVRFAAAIREGFKTQTIRAGRTRHARPGEMLQLFTGMLPAQCQKICEDVLCTEVTAIAVYFDDEGEIDRIVLDGFDVPDLDAFAALDGFTDASDMAAFWKSENAIRPNSVFRGVLIEWSAPRTNHRAQTSPDPGQDLAIHN